MMKYSKLFNNKEENQIWTGPDLFKEFHIIWNQKWRKVVIHSLTMKRKI